MKKITCLLILFLPLSLFASIDVISRSATHVEFRMTTDWSEISQTIDGQEFSLWSADILTDNQPLNGRLTPIATFQVMLPPETMPQIEVLDRNTIQRDSKPFPPTGAVSTKDSPPSPFIDFTGHQSFRGYNLGEFTMYPVEYQSGRAELTTEAKIRVSWTPPATGITKEQFDSVFDREILNKMALLPAGVYRTHKKPALAKPVADIDRNGTWYKIPVNSSGLHRITYSWLQAQEIPTDNIRIDKIRMFAAPNFGLPLDTPPGPSLGEIGPVLREIPIRINQSTSSATLDQGDAIEFYGQATSRFTVKNEKVQFVRNPYSETNYYWLNLPGLSSTSDGLRLQEETHPPTGTPITSVPGYYREEEELHNFFNSGNWWYGPTFFGTSDAQTFVIDEDNLIPDSSVSIEIAVARGNDMNRHTWEFSVNNNNVGQARIGSGAYTPAVAKFKKTFTAQDEVFQRQDNQVEIISRGQTSSAQGHLDYFQLEYTRQLHVPDGTEHYRFFTRTRTGMHTYRVSNFPPDDATILDVTNPETIYAIPADAAGNGVEFTVDFGLLPVKKELVVISGEARIQPEEAVRVEEFETPVLRRTDLQAKYIVITASAFSSEAERLAEFRSSFSSPTDSPLPAHVVTVQQIYNEFSGGIQDPRALRNFLAWAYRSWQSGDPVQYALLFGDGDYDYRNITGNSRIFVPTWQKDSTNEAFSMEIDDRFGLVDGNDLLPDIAIGRLPATTIENAKIMVDKIINYESNAPFGQWRSTITMVGDDPLRPESSHETRHIGRLENSVNPKIPSVFHLRKLYLPDYPIVQDLSSFGVTRPGVTDHLMDQLRQGTVLVNFSGHGSPKVWTQERVLTMERDVSRIDTGDKLPFWVAATCEWGRFDLIGDDCMPEVLMAMAGNGAIGSLSAARVSYLGPNLDFMSRYFGSLFSDNTHPGRSATLGMAQIATKNGKSNDERYVLLGDPALRLATPNFSAQITNVNPDTFAALQHVTLEGAVQLDNATDENQFSGTGYLSVFDSEQRVKHKYNQYDSLDYALPGSRIFYGPVHITNGTFDGEFQIPKDINYTGDAGKMLILYQGADSSITGAGIHKPISFRGTATGVSDSEPPQITVGFQGYNFQSGDVVPTTAVLDVSLADTFGLNLTGSVGHQLKLLVDGPVSRDYNLSEFFSYDLDSYQTGHAIYPLTDLPPGKYTFTVRAWDTSNNLAVQTVDVTLIEGTNFAISQVYNYPNPMQGETKFTFSLSEPGTVAITVYTLAGQPVTTLEDAFSQAGFHTIHWDGQDQYGASLANGVYLYRITAYASQSDKSDRIIGKLAITR